MKIKKIGDFTIKEYALLCKKHLKNGCKDCPFIALNGCYCISTLMYPSGIPFNNIVERKKEIKTKPDGNNIYDFHCTSLFRIIVKHRSKNKHIICVYIVIDGEKWVLVKKFIQKGDVDISEIKIENAIGSIDTTLIKEEEK